MTARQKFWLKVFLALTFPFWIIPLLVLLSIYAVGWIVWEVVSDIVERPSCNDPEDDGP